MRLVSSGAGTNGAGPSSAAATQEENFMDDDTLKCAICMQLCERPVTVRFQLIYFPRSKPPCSLLSPSKHTSILTSSSFFGILSRPLASIISASNASKIWSRKLRKKLALVAATNSEQNLLPILVLTPL